MHTESHTNRSIGCFNMYITHSDQHFTGFDLRRNVSTAVGSFGMSPPVPTPSNRVKPLLFNPLNCLMYKGHFKRHNVYSTVQIHFPPK